MHKSIKVSLICLIGIPSLVIATLLSIFLFKDANDFKPNIEEQAKAQIGLNLKIEGQLSWSLIPIGLEINKLKILDQSEASFASADKIVASIDFWSLFNGAPKVETILLDGLTLELIQTSDTENNWGNILPPTNKVDAQSKQEQEQETSNKPNSLNFLVESLQLNNTQIRFESIPQSIELTISPLNLSLSNITLGKTFPLALSYSLTETKNKIDVNSSLNANLLVSKELNNFTLSNVKNSYELIAPNISTKEINLDLESNIEINTKDETVDISALLISLNNLTIQGQANIKNYSSDLNLRSNISIPEFSLKALLESLDIALPVMQYEEALQTASVSSTVSFENNLLQVQDININLDKSTWVGNIKHALETSASTIRINGDKINLDNYLPHPSELEETNDIKEEPVKQQAANTKTNQDLLPLETLRSLNLDIEFQQESISAKNIETNDVVITLSAKNGKISQTLNGKLFEGSYSSDSNLNIQNNTPTWLSEQSIKDINLAPIFESLNIEALKDYGKVAGLLNLSAKTLLSGNNIHTLKSSAVSNIDFHIDQGAFEGLSLNVLTCKGFAFINKETVDTSTWPKATPFNTLNGGATLKNQIMETRFDLITSGIHADSSGSIDISKNSIDILASLKVIGELGDNACRVNDKVKQIGVPVRCQGAFDTPPAELCKLDASRLGSMAKELAIEEGKRKANKEIDRALDKHLGDKKDQVKSIINKFLK